MNVLQVIELFEKIGNLCDIGDFMNLLCINHTLYNFRNHMIYHGRLNLSYLKMTHCHHTCFTTIFHYRFHFPTYVRHAYINESLIEDYESFDTNHLQSLHYFPHTAKRLLHIFQESFDHLTMLSLDAIYLDYVAHKERIVLNIPKNVQILKVNIINISVILPKDLRELTLFNVNIENKTNVFHRVRKFKGNQSYEIDFVALFPNLEKCTIHTTKLKGALPLSTHTLSLIDLSFQANIDLSTYSQIKVLKVKYARTNMIKKLPPHLHTLKMVGDRASETLVFPSSIEHLTLHFNDWKNEYDFHMMKTIDFLFSNNLSAQRRSKIPIQQCCHLQSDVVNSLFHLRRFHCRVLINQINRVQIILKSCCDLNDLWKYLPSVCQILIIEKLAIRSHHVHFVHQNITIASNFNANVTKEVKIYHVPSHLQYFRVGNLRII